MTAGDSSKQGTLVWARIAAHSIGSRLYINIDQEEDTANTLEKRPGKY